MKTKQFINVAPTYESPRIKIATMHARRSIMVVSNEYLRYGNDPGTIVGGENEQDYGDM